MSVVYEDQLPVLDDSYEGDEVSLLAVRGGKVDAKFRRNYAWAKYAADAGKLKQITVVVEIDRTDWVHTVGAITSALSGARLHDKAKFSLVVTRFEWAKTAEKVTEALVELVALPAPVPGPVEKSKPAERVAPSPSPAKDQGDK